MKLNIANPATGQQKSYEIDDERKFRIFYEKRMSQDVEADALGDEFKGYVLRVKGGNDKQGFPMKQGVLVPHRVRLLLDDSHTCYRARKDGERRRKSVRGCIVAHDIRALHLMVVKQGEQDIPGLTDEPQPKRLGPKRATRIRRFYNLSKEDDVRQFVIRREVVPKKEGAKPYTKAPKIQRLVTPQRLQRRRRQRVLKERKVTAQKEQEADYKAIVAQRSAEHREKVHQLHLKRSAAAAASHK